MIPLYNRHDIYAAFLLWSEKRKETPTDFMDAHELYSMTPEERAKSDTDYFIELLSESQKGS